METTYKIKIVKENTMLSIEVKKEKSKLLFFWKNNSNVIKNKKKGLLSVSKILMLLNDFCNSNYLISLMTYAFTKKNIREGLNKNFKIKIQFAINI